MMPAKLLLRLAYVSWLLAAYLMLGWAGDAAAQTERFALSVNPSKIREDAGATDIEVTVEVTDDIAVDTDTYVLLSAPQATLNSRFIVLLPWLKIAAGEKKATATITFIPTNDSTPDSNLLIEISGNAGSETVASTTITLIDDDRPSTKISLSADTIELNRFDGATEVAITATLDGKVRPQATSFVLIIADHPDLTDVPNTDADDNGRIDDADATKDNREARRDVDYTVMLTTLTIPINSVSGTATLTITPKNRLPGTIRVATPDNDAGTAGIQTADGLAIDPVDIKIGKESVAMPSAITLSQNSIREDAGATPIELRVSLTNALVRDETARFAILPDGAALPSGRTVTGTPIRDVHYRLSFGPPLVIAAGATEGTTTITLTPANDTEVATRDSIYIQVSVGGASEIKALAIVDDDAVSTAVALTVALTSISEGAGNVVVGVTGTLNGKVLATDVVVSLTIDSNFDEAVRDLDYMAALRPLTIPAGQVSGTTTITISPTADDIADDGEKIRLTGQISSGPSALRIGAVEIMLRDAGVGGVPSFATGASIPEITYSLGVPLAAWVLPEATGGDAPLRYSVSTLPAGLTFDEATRSLAGTPTQATNGAVNIIYTVIDSKGASSALIFSIAVEDIQLPPLLAGAQLTATPAEIFEDAGATQIALTVTLAEASATAEVVTFTIAAPSEDVEGTPAVRDVDYVASLEAFVTIPVGATVGTATLIVTPADNTAEDGLRALGVQAALTSGATLRTDIKIVDDDALGTSISLTASPNAISEESPETTIAVTATLNGRALAEDITVSVSIDAASTATRDVDYAAVFQPLIVIPAGSVTGSTQIALRTIADGIAEGNETIKLTGAVDGLVGGEVEIILTERSAAGSSLSFVSTEIADQAYTVGTAITALVLPAATGGIGGLMYTVTALPALPAGLAFDTATRTIAGTPTQATDGAVDIIYTVIDEGSNADVLTFSITVNKALTFDLDLFAAALGGAGKIIPTAVHEFVELPQGIGGTAPLTYSLAPALPAGLTFDAATRTIAGTPLAEREPVYTYTVTDANGASASLLLQTQPAAFALDNNYPNPFNPTTTIRYALPQAADVALTVYNVVGQAVRTLVAEHQSAGHYVVEWNATDDSGHSLSAGMYFYHLEADGGAFRQVKKMLLLK